MNEVEKIKELCKSKKIPISKLERDLGFGNGYINNVKPGKIPSERVRAIADYLDVQVLDILGIDNFKYTNSNGVIYTERRNASEETLLEHAMLIARLPIERRKFIYETIEAQYQNYLNDKKTDTLYSADIESEENN